MKIKIYVSCHKKFFVPNSKYLFPIQVGSLLSLEKMDGYLHDDEGENISELNPFYCELTAIYYAWKNEKSDYYGFFHYRRYLQFYDCKKAYRVENLPCKKNVDNIEKNIDKIVKYDVILPKKENFGISVYDHYRSSRYHKIEDMDKIISIIDSLYPDYASYCKEFLKNNFLYIGNIFIMKEDLFHNYCEWLFSILEKFREENDLSRYSVQEKRVLGFLAERLLGVYLAKNENLRILETSRVHFEGFYGRKNYITKKISATIFPPEGLIRKHYRLKKLRRD